MTLPTKPRQPRRTVRPVHPLRILVATNGDPEARGAIRVAALLARRTTAVVEVLSVVAPFPHINPAGFRMAPPAIMDEENRRAALATAKAQLAEVRGSRQWGVHAELGWPADTIVEAARNWRAGLIIVGLGHHGVAERLIGSETAVNIAKRSSVPLLAVPEDIERLPANAVAAIDFTESSSAAAKLAARLLTPTGVLTLMHISMLARATTEAGTLTDVYSAGAHEKLDSIAAELSAWTRRKVTSVVESGEIVERLLERTGSDHYDLIALGSHARGLLDRLLMGSVRSRVLRHAACAVLIAPENGEADAP